MGIRGGKPGPMAYLRTQTHLLRPEHAINILAYIFLIFLSLTNLAIKLVYLDT